MIFLSIPINIEVYAMELTSTYIHVVYALQVGEEMPAIYVRVNQSA